MVKLEITQKSLCVFHLRLPLWIRTPLIAFKPLITLYLHLLQVGLACTQWSSIIGLACIKLLAHVLQNSSTLGP